jgi:hypothetical protein
MTHGEALALAVGHVSVPRIGNAVLNLQNKPKNCQYVITAKIQLYKPNIHSHIHPQLRRLEDLTPLAPLLLPTGCRLVSSRPNILGGIGRCDRQDGEHAA